MHRVELKGGLLEKVLKEFMKFLMHRVELKVDCKKQHPLLPTQVPNAPCGVESSTSPTKRALNSALFLMHRVELKAEKPLKRKLKKPQVPNAPCGVERW